VARIVTIPLLLRTLTPLHVGAGRRGREVDLPVQRDSKEVPMIPSTSIRGTFRTFIRYVLGENDEELLGEHVGEIRHLLREPRQGKIYFTDAYLFLYPLTHNGRTIYLTSRYCIYRTTNILSLCGLEDLKCKIEINDYEKENIILRTRDKVINIHLKYSNNLKSFFTQVLENIYHIDNAGRIIESIRLVDDEYLIEIINQHNLKVRRIALRDEGYILKKVEEGALWCEEYVPSNTFFILAVACYEDVLSKLMNILRRVEVSLLQVGGRETIGKGFCKLYVGTCNYLENTLSYSSKSILQ